MTNEKNTTFKNIATHADYGIPTIFTGLSVESLL
jgi:hypothetical protein